MSRKALLAYDFEAKRSRRRTEEVSVIGTVHHYWDMGMVSEPDPVGINRVHANYGYPGCVTFG
jgi:hypothetical protein